MACVISVEATFLGLRAARFNLDEIATRRGYGRPQVEAFEGEFWGTGSDEVTLGSIAKSDKLLQRIAAIIQRVALGSEQDVIGVAISFSAAVRSDGMVHLSHEGEYIQIRVRRELQDKLSELWQHPVDVTVENRSNMGAWGEYQVGQGAVMRANSINPVHTIYITVSGNIGVGIIADGKLYTGLKGYAGEMGHLIINPASDRQCPACFQKGCASEVASGRALVHDVQQYASSGGATACVTSLATATAAADAAKYDPGYIGTVQEGRTTHRIDARSILRASQSGTCQIADQAVDNLVTHLVRRSASEIQYLQALWAGGTPDDAAYS
jgi:predicted NBD/HSP70 family sugar kinase